MEPLQGRTQPTMKQTLAGMTATALLFSLTGCGGQTSQNPAPAPAAAPAGTPAAKPKPEVKAEVLTCPAPGAGLDAQVNLDGAVYGAVKTTDLAIAVTKLQTAAEVGTHMAQGQYLIVTYGLQNITGAQVYSPLLSDLVLVSDGKRFKADSFPGIKYRDIVGERGVNGLNPDLSAIVTYVYDVPKTLDPCKAEVEITRRPEGKPKVTFQLPVGVAKR